MTKMAMIKGLSPNTRHLNNAMTGESFVFSIMCIMRPPVAIDHFLTTSVVIQYNINYSYPVSGCNYLHQSNNVTGMKSCIKTGNVNKDDLFMRFIVLKLLSFPAHNT